MEIENQIIQGDVIKTLDEFPNESVKLTVTSPPYKNIRSYEVENQWGLEKTLREYLGKMQNLCERIDRVTTKDGFFALNIGDVKENGNWLLIPEEVSLIMKRLGWEIRSKIVWHKLNPMPTSSPKGFTPSWEPIYLFAKTKDSIFNYKDVMVTAKTKSKKFNVRVRDYGKGKFDQIYSATQEEKETHNEKGEKFQDNTIGADGKPKINYEGFNSRYEHKEMKRMRDVWSYSTWRAKTKKKHAAPFPPYIPEPFIKACSNEGDLVLDPFSGTGTTCIAAKKLKRNYVGIEIDKFWCEQSKIELKKI